MGFWSGLMGILGFGVGITVGLLLGYLMFIYFETTDVKDPVIRTIEEFDLDSLVHILPEIPLWMRHPDVDRVHWLNHLVSDMWPYLDKAICTLIMSKGLPTLAEYAGKFRLQPVGFESLSLGTLPPIIHGIKVHESYEKELIFESAVRWAGNPDITLVLKFSSLPITVQLIDLQIYAAPRITLKPLVPTFPCFSSVTVSLLEKPHIDFGLKILGGDIMAIPGLYQFVQKTVINKVASLYCWPNTLKIPILDSLVGDLKKPVGILCVKVQRASQLLKMFLGTYPYVTLSVSGEGLPARKSTIKINRLNPNDNLNPEWNEEFKLIVGDPQSQVLELHVYSWEKFGRDHKLGMQVLPLNLLIPHKTREFTLDLCWNLKANDSRNTKQRGKIMVETRFVPFREDNERFSGLLDEHLRTGRVSGASGDASLYGEGVLLVTVFGAEDVEGEHHSDAYALVLHGGDRRKTKMTRRSRDPKWNEHFLFMFEEVPLSEKIRIEVMNKRRGIGFRPKKSLGYVDIKLIDVVYNGRINEKYNLVGSGNGMIHVELQWTMIEV